MGLNPRAPGRTFVLVLPKRIDRPVTLGTLAMSVLLTFGLVAFVVLVLCAGGGVALMTHRRTPCAGIVVLMAMPVLGIFLAFAGYMMLAPSIAGPGILSFSPGMGMVLRGGLTHPGEALPPWSLATREATQRPETKAEAHEPAATPPRAEAPEAAGIQYSPAAKAANAHTASPPEWVGAPPRRTPEGYQVSVATDPFATPLECQRQLPEVLRRAVDQYVALYLGDEALAARIELPAEFILRQVVKAQWEESYESSVGPMVRWHALLLFDKQLNAQIDEAYHRCLVQYRVLRLGVLLAGVLALLAAAWAYLRLDLATGGRYRWRLRLAAGAAILGVIAAGWAILA